MSIQATSLTKPFASVAIKTKLSFDSTETSSASGPSIGGPKGTEIQITKQIAEIKKKSDEQIQQFSRLDKWAFSYYRESGLLGWISRFIILILPTIFVRLEHLTYLHSQLSELNQALKKDHSFEVTPTPSEPLPDLVRAPTSKARKPATLPEKLSPPHVAIPVSTLLFAEEMPKTSHTPRATPVLKSVAPAEHLTPPTHTQPSISTQQPCLPKVDDVSFSYRSDELKAGSKPLLTPDHPIPAIDPPLLDSVADHPQLEPMKEHLEISELHQIQKKTLFFTTLPEAKLNRLPLVLATLQSNSLLLKLVAAKQNGLAFKFVSTDLQADKEIALAAVSQISEQLA